MAAAVAAEQQEQQPQPGGADAPQEMSVDAVNLMIPGLIEKVEV